MRTLSSLRGMIAAFSAALLAIASLALAGPASAVDGTWKPFGGKPMVLSITPDTDGNLIVGGIFTTISNADGTPVAMNNIGLYDPSSGTWSAFGTGADNTVRKIIANGDDIYAVGDFQTINGVDTGQVAKLVDGAWQPVGPLKTDYWVTDLAFDGSTIYAVGNFTRIGSDDSTNIAKWNGTTWTSYATEVKEDTTNARLYTAAMYKGDLYVGGTVNKAGSDEIYGIMRWTGTKWAKLGGGISQAEGYGWPYVSEIVVNDGLLYVGGSYNKAGGAAAYSIATWNGTAWKPLGAGVGGGVQDMDFNGKRLYIVGDFTYAGQLQVNMVARWNGEEWANLGSGFSNPPFYSASAISASDAGVFVGSQSGDGFLQWKPKPTPDTQLDVTAETAAKIALDKKAKLVKKIVTDGKVTTAKASCTLKGSALKAKQAESLCGLSESGKGANYTVTAKPTCTKGLAIDVRIVAEATGLKKATWTQSWKVDSKKAVACKV